MRVHAGRAARASVLAALLCASMVTSGSAASSAGNHETVDTMFCIQRNFDSACYNGAAQTLTADMAGELAWVELPLSRASFTTLDLAIEVRSESPYGQTLATSDPVAATEIPIGEHDGDPTDYAWIRFAFPVPLAVDAGDPLAIVIDSFPLSTSSDPAWGWGKSNSDGYPNGVAWGGSAWGGGYWGSYQDGSDFAFRTSVNISLPTPELDVAIDPAGGADPKAGTVTIRGSLACAAEPVDYELYVTVRQRVGRLFTIQGDAWHQSSCDSAQPWELTVLPGSGLFKPGHVTVTLDAWFCDEFGQCGSTSATAAVKVVRGR